MESQRVAHLSILFTFAMLVLLFSFGFQNYSRTEKAIIADLNQALQQTVLQNSGQWINKDTLQTYSRLVSIFGNPISIKSYNRNFAEALHLRVPKEETGIIMHLVNKQKKPKKSAPIRVEETTENYMASDTVIWMSAPINTPDVSLGEIGISFQGYANCSAKVIFSLADKTIPFIFLIIAFISATVSFYLYRSKKTKSQPSSFQEKNIAYGNLVLSCDKACFYKEDNEKLKLTPQQYTLMEMFFLSPVHVLSRSEIGETLWPGKANADETLNTLMRRLRPLIEEHSNLKITTDRGRAYILEMKETTERNLQAG